jgi:hypothetical protein
MGFEVNPTEQLVAAAAKEVEVKDAKGRVIKLRKPGILGQFRLVEMIGQSAQNATYLNMVTPLLFIVEIDGQPEGQPAKKSELEGLIQRLGEDGVEAVMKGVMENFGPRDVEEDRAALKK